ncbi:hypothetical protein CR155_09935 [Pollutimonas nitritireducens]|uniref:DUF4168 domain-containing protein n=1 Tax=Pollutimonas nitritireducens TaxID=2045209 RepID=A0A2N4UFI3_9BURK|nr:DUF4168 domain-containing protein [Pollutimonas nitritireducens]PLC53766.1 hypothetical protein CR155_09935 [Pollutimonas nitritireducens]
MQLPYTRTLSAVLLTFGLSTGVAMAQQAAPSQSPNAPVTAPSANFSDAQLEKFVTASQKVAMISQEYTPKLEESADEGKRKKVFKEADDKMVQAVHAEGMTVDQFNGMNQAIQSNPQLVQRVQQLIK